MPGLCSHEFFWPLKSGDGHYYQVCRLCGAQSEYDWKKMERLDGEPATAGTSGTSSPKAGVHPQAASRLRLLVELEPAHRVFLRNLADLLRRAPAGANGLRPMPLWREVFFYSDLPWQRFAESMVCHMIALAVVLILSQWSTQDLPRRRSMFENSHITYYKPSGSFPALRSSPARPRPSSRKQDSASRGSIRVAPERAQASLKPPTIKLNGPARPNLAGTSIAGASPVPPMMPFASTGLSHLPVPAGSTSIVAPPPEVSQGTSRQLGLPQGSVVAPAPEPGAVSSGRVMTVPGAAAVGPPPVVQASISRLGDMNIGPSAVVAPAPRLPMGEEHAISGGAQATLGSPIALAVPPPPSAPRGGTLGNGRAGALSGGGLQVVPPPPSVQAVQNVGDPAGSGQMGSWSSTGLQPVPPAPSLQSAGNSGVGRPTNLPPSSGLQGVAPTPSVGAGGNSGRAGRQVALNASPALGPAAPPVIDNAPQRTAEKASEPATEEMPLRLIGMAMALPTSSYFSNYEVYIAERRLRKNLTELVKLVYVYLPYQRRLSEYGVDNSRVYRLRVSRDRTCDESLMQMTWPEGDPHPDAQNPADAPGLSAADKKSALPCYRTTADDYRKAMSHR